MQAANELHTHVDASRPRPVIAGTDIKVSQIALAYEHLAMSPDEIADAHPHLTLAQIHAALAYYYDHQDQIRDELNRDEELVAVLRNQYPSRLTEKLSR
jgi:uncharacterized protein (DUF433 family)